MPKKNWNEVIQELTDKEAPETPTPKGLQTVKLTEEQILEVLNYVGVVPRNTEIVSNYFTNKNFVIVYKHKDLKRA